MLETNCLSVYSPSFFFPSSFEIDCCFLGWTLEEIDMHSAWDMLSQKYLSLNYSTVASRTYGQSFTKALVSSASSLIVLYLKSACPLKTPAFPVALLKSDWYLSSLFPLSHWAWREKSVFFVPHHYFQALLPHLSFWKRLSSNLMSSDCATPPLTRVVPTSLVTPSHSLHVLFAGTLSLSPAQWALF